MSPSSSSNLKGLLSTSSANSSQTSLLLKEREKKKKMVDAMIMTCEGMDVIEAGLIQRLKQCQLMDEKIPSDVVSAVLTEEHIRALKVSSNAERLYQQQLLELQQNQLDMKKKVRHVQVQTLPWNGKELSLQQQYQEEEKEEEKVGAVAMSPDTTNTTTTTTTTTENDHLQQPPSLSPSTSSTSSMTNHHHDNKEIQQQQQEEKEKEAESESIEELKRQLLQERQERQRLEASLQATCDHFEVLSGLAYKKLRELWEEKIRWENTCVELNGRLLAMGKNADGSSLTDGENNSGYYPL
ncbi:hypothetical protein BJ944DRAFT_270430 [Cunninghamella echinulata]|nr:hypothetical protein BJ944DRAFT_270430 [Cunninghamella echinulata]